MKIYISLISLIALVGCEDIAGNLQVFQRFNVNTSNGVKIAEVGNYNTSLDIKRDRVVATVKTDSGKIKVTILIPDSVRIPANGEFTVSAVQSGQPFGMLGTNKTVETKSKVKTEYLNCMYDAYDVVCNPQGCHQVPVRRWGHQYTEYYLRTVKKDLILNALASTSESIAATFTGASSFSEKVIIRQNQCF